jgi:hypothetical protein
MQKRAVKEMTARGLAETRNQQRPVPGLGRVYRKETDPSDRKGRDSLPTLTADRISQSRCQSRTVAIFPTEQSATDEFGMLRDEVSSSGKMPVFRVGVGWIENVRFCYGLLFDFASVVQFRAGRNVSFPSHLSIVSYADSAARLFQWRSMNVVSTCPSMKAE